MSHGYIARFKSDTTYSYFNKQYNYESIITYDTNLIKIKTKVKTVKITGDHLLLKYIEPEEIGIKGLIYSLEYID